MVSYAQRCPNKAHLISRSCASGLPPCIESAWLPDGSPESHVHLGLYFSRASPRLRACCCPEPGRCILSVPCFSRCWDICQVRCALSLHPCQEPSASAFAAGPAVRQRGAAGPVHGRSLSACHHVRAQTRRLGDAGEAALRGCMGHQRGWHACVANKTCNMGILSSWYTIWE